MPKIFAQENLDMIQVQCIVYIIDSISKVPILIPPPKSSPNPSDMRSGALPRIWGLSHRPAHPCTNTAGGLLFSDSVWDSTYTQTTQHCLKLHHNWSSQ